MPRHATSTSYGREKGNTPGSKLGSPGAIYHKRMKWLAELAAKSRRFEVVLTDPESPLDDFIKVFDRVSDRAHGKPVQPNAVSLSDPDGKPLTVVFRHERSK